MCVFSVEALAAGFSLQPTVNIQKVTCPLEEGLQEFGVEYLPTDLKKQDGFKRSVQLAREMGIYRQDYCGCEYSQRQKAGGRREEKK